MCDKECFKKLETKIDDVIANVGRISSFSHNAMTNARVAAAEAASLSKALEGIPKRVGQLELTLAELRGMKNGATIVTVAGWTVLVTCIGLAIAWVKK